MRQQGQFKVGAVSLTRLGQREPRCAQSIIRFRDSFRSLLWISSDPGVMIVSQGRVTMWQPVSVRDVAEYILQKQGSMTTMKLQKLVYYAQAWSLVWDERPLFREDIQAWANGPVTPELYLVHRGQFRIAEIPDGHPENLDDLARETIDAILDYYGSRPAHWLSELTHMEDPWLMARQGLDIGERGSRTITHAALLEYYDGLQTADDE